MLTVLYVLGCYQIIMIHRSEVNAFVERVCNHMRPKISSMSIYPVSAFNEALDYQLQRLVVLLQFDFERISTQLKGFFPQFDYKLTRNSVAYRWTQIHRQKNISQRRNQLCQQISCGRSDSTMPDSADDAQQQARAHSINQQAAFSTQKLRIALQLARFTDREEEEEGFLVYLPRFSSNSLYRLERQKLTIGFKQILPQVQQMMAFGSFENAGPQQIASAIPETLSDIELFESAEAAAPLSQNDSSDQEGYFKENWDSYESD